MSQAQNHPKKGSTITVDPIRELKDIKAIKKLLQNNQRDLCLFVVGINTNLRASDLLQIKAGQVRDLKKPVSEIQIIEKKTNKLRRVVLNEACIDVIKAVLASRDYKDDDILFRGQRGPLTVSTVNRLVKSWCREINLKGNYGSHTLRKTWGYHQRVTFGRDVPTLMECFNHSTQKQTLAYLGITSDEVKSVFSNVL